MDPAVRGTTLYIELRFLWNEMVGSDAFSTSGSKSFSQKRDRLLRRQTQVVWSILSPKEKFCANLLPIVEAKYPNDENDDQGEQELLAATLVLKCATSAENHLRTENTQCRPPFRWSAHQISQLVQSDKLAIPLQFRNILCLEQNQLAIFKIKFKKFSIIKNFFLSNS